MADDPRHAQMRAERAQRVEAQKQADERRKLTLAEKAATGVALTLDELADATGNKRRLKPGLVLDGVAADTHAYSPEHAAAAQLHGWTAHAHHSVEPLRLKADDYRAAIIAAACSDKPKLVPHEPALAPHLKGN